MWEFSTASLAALRVCGKPRTAPTASTVPQLAGANRFNLLLENDFDCTPSKKKKVGGLVGHLRHITNVA